MLPIKVQFSNQKGVSFLFVVLIMSVILSISLGVSRILIQQIKIVEEIGDSMISLYAADSGVEEQLYDLHKLSEGEHQSSSSAVLSNNSSFSVTTKCSPTNTDCFSGFEVDDNCKALNFCLKSIGSYQKARRAIETKY